MILMIRSPCLWKTIPNLPLYMSGKSSVHCHAKKNTGAATRPRFDLDCRFESKCTELKMQQEVGPGPEEFSRCRRPASESATNHMGKTCQGNNNTHSILPKGRDNNIVIEIIRRTPHSRLQQKQNRGQVDYQEHPQS
jgi:hypothetical protein